MSVTATFEPAHTPATPGTTTLDLRLHNAGSEEEVVRLSPSGALSTQVTLGSETVYLDPGETLTVPVQVAVDAGLTSGDHSVGIEVALADGSTVQADATIGVAEMLAYDVALTPSRSASSSSGKHRVVVDNRGNAPISLDMSARSLDSGATIELSTIVLNVDPNSSGSVDVRVKPRSTFWSGGTEQHEFAINAVGSDNVMHELAGSFEQRPKTPSWLGPALAGMLGALVLGALAWFLLLKPSVESIADDRAEAANLAERTEFDQTLTRLEQESIAARQLPLGAPADQRLTAEAEPGGSASESFTIAADRKFSVTDVVFQNPGGSVGRISLMRNGQVLLESDLANFRDLDFHFVAPFQFDASDTMEIKLDCDTPGPSETTCAAGALVIGFVDTAE